MSRLLFQSSHDLHQLKKLLFFVRASIICSYVDGLEKKIDSMKEELTNMQNQIKEMQEDTLVNNAKKALSEAQERLNVRCE